MAEYKNWYLAGGSGMKDERKKLKLIILQCIAVITANFITIWYFEELFFRGFWYVIFASFILTLIMGEVNLLTGLVLTGKNLCLRILLAVGKAAVSYSLVSTLDDDRVGEVLLICCPPAPLER